MMPIRVYLFFFLQLFLTGLGVWAIGREIILGKGEILPWLWLAGFGILFWNVIYLFLMSVFSLFIKPKELASQNITNYPRTALCYFIRNEDTELLIKRMDWSFEGNRIPRLDCWILSDSSPEWEALELEMINKLRQKYSGRVFYRRRINPVERKQGNLKDFLGTHPEYDYLYLCDADSMVPKDTVLMLIQKAEHPENQDIALFQTLIRTAHAKTYYAKFEGIASETGQRLFFRTHQAIFGNSISFGHHCLIRKKQFEKITLPNGLLSHDNWDSALLDQLRYRVVFVPEVETFDEVPANYLEARTRESRWAQGTLQGIPLIFMKGLSPGMRFMAFHSVYCYLTQPVFLIWFLLGLFTQSFYLGELMSFKTDVIFQEQFMNRNVVWILIFSMAVIFLHKFVLVRNRNDLKRYFYEILFSTLIFSGNFLYSTWDMLKLPFKKLVWKPMKKDPHDYLDFGKAVKTLWTGTLIGVMGLLYIAQGTPHIQWAGFPLFISLSLSIPVVYLSAKLIRKEAI